MGNKITLTADIIEFCDDFCRRNLEKFDVRLETINQRTKKQTIEIRELKRKVNELEKELSFRSNEKC